MNLRALGLALLVCCILGGIIAALFSPALAATLTLPATPGVGTAGNPGTSGKTPVGTSGLATQPAVEPAPTGMVTGVVLAHDTFQRPDQKFWGLSSDRRSWGADGNSKDAFSITNHAGQITGGSGIFEATLNVPAANSDLLISGSLSTFENDGDINLGIVLRWKDTNNWYKVLIDGQNLQVVRDLNGQITTLKSQTFQAQPGQVYNIRFRTMGSYLMTRAWADGQSEPANWSMLVIDTALTTGISGVRVKLVAGAIVRINSFIETDVTNSM